jgi:acetyl-CoA carboxylase carboxyltransferase component
MLGIPSSDPRVPFDPRDVIARIVDDSDFDEFKPLYGSSLVTGFAEFHGYPIGILANHRGVLFNEESQKGAQFIQLANQIDTARCSSRTPPATWSARSTSSAASSRTAQDDQRVANSQVPHLTIQMAASYGAGNYGMCGSRTARGSCSRGRTRRPR